MGVNVVLRCLVVLMLLETRASSPPRRAPRRPAPPPQPPRDRTVTVTSSTATPAPSTRSSTSSWETALLPEGPANRHRGAAVHPPAPDHPHQGDRREVPGPGRRPGSEDARVN